jgi:integrase
MNEGLTFTEKRIENLPMPLVGSKEVYYRDAKTRGFAVAVYPTGARTFVLYRKIQGRPERVIIGKWPDLPVEQARKIADRMNGEIAEGKNPAEERRAKRLEGTFKSLWEQYLAEYARRNKRARSVAEDEGIHKRYLSGWDSRRLSTITRRDARHLHADIGEQHGTYAANRTLALVSKMFNFAIAAKEWRGDNPCKGVEKFDEEERTRFLTGDELPRFLKALAEEPSQDFREFISLALLTGARRGNVVAMRWDEIDFSGAVWTIPASKAKGRKEIVIPLAGPAMKILEPRRKRISSEWVFPSSEAECGHVTEFRKPWSELLKRAKITGLRLHDVRRTLGTWMSKGGTVVAVIKAAMGHKDITTTQIYTQAENPEVRRAFEDTAKRMLEQGGSAPFGPP